MDSKFVGAPSFEHISYGLFEMEARNAKISDTLVIYWLSALDSYIYCHKKSYFVVSLAIRNLVCLANFQLDAYFHTFQAYSTATLSITRPLIAFFHLLTSLFSHQSFVLSLFSSGKCKYLVLQVLTWTYLPPQLPIKS